MIEILPDIKGVDFDSAWEKRVETTVDPDTGLKAFLVSRDDLIAAKLAPRDLKPCRRQGHPRRGQSVGPPKKPRNHSRTNPATGSNRRSTMGEY